MHVYCVTGKSNIKMLQSKLIKNKILEWVKLSPFWIFVQFYKAEHHKKGNLVFSKIRHWSSENSPVFTKIFKLHFKDRKYNPLSIHFTWVSSMVAKVQCLFIQFLCFKDAQPFHFTNGDHDNIHSLQKSKQKYISINKSWN